MELRTVQWNIGGGNIRSLESDPTEMASYQQEDLRYIIEKLYSYQPDIVTLQEVHQDIAQNQAEGISQRLGLPYLVSDVYNASHLNPEKQLNQAIISRFPLKEHSFALFFNPMYRKVMPDGSEWVSHNKGVTRCVAEIEDTELVIETLHLIPFRKFDADVNDESGKKVRASIEALLEKARSPYLLQGDFNYPDIKTLLPGIYENQLHEVGGDIGTTPKGRVYDHVLFRGFKQSRNPLVDSSVLTDHYPVMCQFEF